MIPQDAALQLELDDRDGLVHLGGEFISFPALLQFSFPLAVAGQKKSAGIITVGFQRKLGERAQVNAVAVL